MNDRGVYGCWTLSPEAVVKTDDAASSRRTASVGKIAVNLVTLSRVPMDSESILDKSILHNLDGSQVSFGAAFLPRNWRENA
jgi:hypothetical protein